MQAGTRAGWQARETCHKLSLNCRVPRLACPTVPSAPLDKPAVAPKPPAANSSVTLVVRRKKSVWFSRRACTPWAIGNWPYFRGVQARRLNAANPTIMLCRTPTAFSAFRPPYSQKASASRGPTKSRSPLGHSRDCGVVRRSAHNRCIRWCSRRRRSFRAGSSS